MKTFLKAKWDNLIMINFEVPKELLTPYVPAGTKLDLWGGKALVSVVAFMFNKTSVIGIPAFGNRKFPEVNLRMYLKRVLDPTKLSDSSYEVRRGVAFIKEIVPKPLVSSIANNLFKEHYETCDMKYFAPDFLYKEHFNEESNLGYSVRKNGEHKFSAFSLGVKTPLKIGSFEEFIAEHYWGYSKMNETNTIEYEVKHPRWNLYQGAEVKFDCDFGILFGEKWAFLNELIPLNSFVAEGSAVSVSFPKFLKL